MAITTVQRYCAACDIATEVSLQRTHSHVFVETGRLAEALGTYGTTMRLVFLVYVQYVYAQTITLLERPVDTDICIASNTRDASGYSKADLVSQFSTT